MINYREKTKLSKTRRKLIVASAATPFIATLKSGAAMAATSAITCIASDNSHANIATAYENSDKYARTEVEFYHDPNKPTTEPDKRNVFKIIDSYYRQNGNRIDPIDKPHVINRLEHQGTAWVLKMYDGDMNLENISYVGDAPTNKEFLSYKSKNPYNDPGAFPLHGTCLTSVADSNRLL